MIMTNSEREIDRKTVTKGACQVNSFLVLVVLCILKPHWT